MNEKDDIIYEIMAHEQGSFLNNKENKNKYQGKINSNKDNANRSITQLFVHDMQDKELYTTYHITTMEAINELDTIYHTPNDASKYHTEVKDDEEIIEGFDPSRLPPRIWAKIPSACEAMNKEISNLLADKGKEGPSLVVVSLSDPTYKTYSKNTYGDSNEKKSSRYI